MDFNLFGNIISILGKISQSVLSIKNINEEARNNYREILNETCQMLDLAILLVANRLGDILQLEDPNQLAQELISLENYKEWLKMERDVRLCNSLRVAGREMTNLLKNASIQAAIQNVEVFKRFIENLLLGETQLATYITEALANLAKLGKDLKSSPALVDNAKRTIRGVRKALLIERDQLITIQTKIINSVI